MSEPLTDEVARELGFEDVADFFRRVSSVDLSTPERLDAFKCWQANDGTAAGLDRLVESQGGLL